VSSFRTLTRGLPLTALVVVAISCGGDDDTATPVGTTSLVDAASTTLDETALSFELEFSIDGPGVHEDGRLEGSGDFDANRGTVTATTGGIEAKALFDGDRFWLKSSDEAFTSLMPDGKEWVRGNLSELADDAAVTRLEPLSLLYLLNGAESVEADDAVGSTSYRFDVDMQAAVDSAPSDRRDEVAALIESSQGQPRVSGEAIVDGDGHVRELTVDGTVAASEGDVDISYEATLDRLDEAVSFEPPPDDEVVALAEVPELTDQLNASPGT
jgi:hypothetical protein